MTETRRAKQHYEKLMFNMGVTIQSLQSDNGIFASAEFEESLQDIKLSGMKN